MFLELLVSRKLKKVNKENKVIRNDNEKEKKKKEKNKSTLQTVTVQPHVEFVDTGALFAICVQSAN